MRSFSVSSSAGLLALSVGCAVPGAVHTEEIKFEDQVVFHFSEIGPRHSMSILNTGPGPIEVLLGEEAAHSHPIEIPKGTFEYIRPGQFSSLEIRHPGNGAAKIEWTILEMAFAGPGTCSEVARGLI